MIDALIGFMNAHPSIACEANVKGLDGGKNGLSFPDYALIVPYWNGGEIQLRLLKSGEDWDPAAHENLDRVVAEDVSGMTDSQLEHLLDGIFREANPNDQDEGS